MDISVSQGAVLLGVVGLAYVIFGIAGFGTALIAGPALTQFMPLSRVVPMLAMLDFVAAVTNVVRDGKRADLPELKRLVPSMMIGSGAGAAILLKTKPELLLLMLGVFVVAYSLYSLSGIRPQARFPARLSIPFGLVGGVFSALFGSGGFLYAIYLAGRIESKESLRVTQSTLIGLSTLTRLVIFLLAGVYRDLDILIMAAALLPAMFAGVWIGRRITLRLSREQFIRILNVVVLGSGVALLVRYFS